MAATAGNEPGLSQEPRASFESPRWVAGTQSLEPFSDAFLRQLAGAKLEAKQLDANLCPYGMLVSQEMALFLFTISEHQSL